jgi:hypothetical protein
MAGLCERGGGGGDADASYTKCGVSSLASLVS